ncbi:DUF983 domain-containing protein [Putridiphycobacter roseus]|uniref:DUF983 domain-containing protein n=1 Tax=Putridiphycobacter roseus TaxID=2219161 RepID=UPI0011B8399D
MRKIFQFVNNVYSEKCPSCKQGYAFKKGTKLFAVPEMNVACDACQYKFEREPGYFIGAMYISYGLSTFQAIVAYLLTNMLWPSISIALLLGIITMTLVLFAKLNFKWARLIYIYIFPW